MNQLLKHHIARGNENSKVVALAKNSDRLKPQQPRARFAQQTPRSTQCECQFRLQVYQRARYYDCNTNEFCSKDPLEYVDGMSLYLGYFVPGGVDPSGIFVQQIADRDYPWDFVGPLPPGATYGGSWEEWWNYWKATHPGLKPGIYDQVEETSKLGCIGLTLVELGIPFGSIGTELANLKNDSGIFSDCFAEFHDAESAMTLSNIQGKCKGKDCFGKEIGEAKIFTVLFHVLRAKKVFAKKGKKIIMTCFDPTSTKPVTLPNGIPGNAPNFDFGFWDPVTQMYLHANHGWPGMTVKWSTADEFMAPYADDETQSFNMRAHCVACADWTFGKDQK